MSYVLINRNQTGRPNVLSRYATLGGARSGMRRSNRNAGWVKVNRCFVGFIELEWSVNVYDIYDYAPYAIMHEYHYTRKYMPETY